MRIYMYASVYHRFSCDIQTRKPAVDSFMIDFEAALWTAVRKVFKDALVKSCVFHLTQAVWRHVQLLGLQRAYNEHNRTHRFIR